MTRGRQTSPLRPLRREELPIATETLTLAFDDDPLFQFLLPDPKPRRAWISWFMRSTLNECIAIDGAFTLSDDEGGPNAGALGVMKPGTWPRPLLRTVRALAIPRALPSWRWLKVGLHLEGRIRELHPTDPHLYVNLVGVHPSKKGQGLGAALVRHAAEIAKAANVRMYLETSNPKNLPFYRRFGFEVKTEITSHIREDDPHGSGPPLWTMET
jgi:ribosomal protein S18 acetylase RimI-like enzyme